MIISEHEPDVYLSIYEHLLFLHAQSPTRCSLAACVTCESGVPRNTSADSRLLRTLLRIITLSVISKRPCSDLCNTHSCSLREIKHQLLFISSFIFFLFNICFVISFNTKFVIVYQFQSFQKFHSKKLYFHSRNLLKKFFIQENTFKQNFHSRKLLKIFFV